MKNRTTKSVFSLSLLYLSIHTSVAIAQGPSRWHTDDIRYDSTQCSKELVDKYYDKAIDIVGIYEFGKEIQDAVRDDDVDAFLEKFTYVFGNKIRTFELRKKGFRGYFGDDWVDQVLNDQPSCEPYSDRNFNLGKKIYYYSGSYLDRDWKTAVSGIYHVEGIQDKTYASEGITLNDNEGNPISPYCLSDEYIDNSGEDHGLKEILDKFEDKNVDLTNPGLTLRTTMDYSKKFEEELFPYDTFPYTNLKYCENNIETVEDGWVRGPKHKSYKVLREVPVSMCNELAPGLSGSCTRSYFIERTSEYFGDYPSSRYGIYGIFEVNDDEVISLLKWTSLNKGFDLIDDHENKQD